MAAAEHLKSGSRLGPYELLSPLGAGGMGEVWKARDTRLNRVVAVKFSHAGLSDRFQREARAIAALNHPNIATLHDVGDNYIVMEYVDGEPVRPPGDTRKLLDIAVQIADGLAAAHAAGIVHRDLKPDNILLTKGGRVKILDFGLAKQTVKPAQDEATKTVVTDPGTVMGTVAYMSPEQARGQELDARSDQFSFGMILYELATGKRAFQRPTAAETMAAIIREDPEPLPGSVPAPFRWSIGRLLAKDPACRYDTTRGLYLELQTLRERLSETAPVATTAAPVRRRWLRPTPPVLASFLAGAVILLALWLREPWRPDVSNYRFAPFATEAYGEYGAAWSPDGRSLAYVATTSTEARIMVRNADGSAPGVLAKIPLPFGVISTIVESLSWSSDGTRLFFLRGRQPWSVARAGGVPEPLPAPAKSVTYSIALSPDGKSLALLRDADHEGKRTRRVWISPPTAASPAPLPYALQCCEVTYGNLSWSPDSSRLLVVESILGRRRRLLLMERDGHTRTLAEFTGLNEVQHAWLPDNRHAVLALPPEKTGLQVIDTETGQVRAFLPSPELAVFPSVSPDGKRIVYTQGLTRFRLMEIPFDGTPPRQFLSSKVDQSELTWSPAGDEFAYIYGDEIRVRNRAGTFDRVAVSPKDFVMAGSRVLERPSLSPDGQRIAYGMAGRGQGITVWISPPGGGAPVPLLQDQRWTLNPVWSPDGAFLYFNMPPGGLYRHRVGSAGEPERISQGCNASSSGASFILCASPAAGLYTVSLDGKNEHRISSDPVVSAALTRDERSIYALRRKEQKQDLVRVDVATGRTEVLSVLAEPLDIRGPLGGPTRLAISPDEKSVIVTVRSNEGDIWVLDGFEPPKSFWERLWPWKR